MAYRYLFEQMVRREMRQKYKGSALGIVWYVVNPLVLMGAYYLMFGVVFRAAAEPDYPLFLLVGLVVWIFFSQAAIGASTSLIEQSSLIRKARFPREVIPAAVVSVQSITFLVLLGIVTPLTLAVRGTVDVALLLLPLILACLFAFVLGFAFAVAVLHAYFRDVAPILTAALLPWFFLSPIFFDPNNITQKKAAVFALEWINPVAPFIVAVRDVLYGGVVPDLNVLAYVAIAGALVLAGGVWLFRRMQGELAVVL